MGIAFFDMDLTLTRVVSSVFLGTELGKREEVEKLEEMVMYGKISDADFTKKLGELVKGCTVDRLWEIYRRMPVISGIEDSVWLLKGEGFRTAIVTAGVGKFAEFMIDEYGFDYYFANATVEKDGAVVAFAPPIVTPKAKADYVRGICKRHGIEPEKCIAFGDSSSDVPMLRAVGLSVAVNYKGNVCKHATYSMRPCENIVRAVAIALGDAVED
jgi:phosphoserine phosphatase